ncbi:hypothetical protein OH77DRAFT_706937 [Trametes cingulata]|nr:hypothetical protein OH77DRAFT_706937 [Trametes cingulata]
MLSSHVKPQPNISASMARLSHRGSDIRTSKSPQLDVLHDSAAESPSTNIYRRLCQMHGHRVHVHPTTLHRFSRLSAANASPTAHHARVRQQRPSRTSLTASLVLPTVAIRSRLWEGCISKGTRIVLPWRIDRHRARSVLPAEGAPPSFLPPQGQTRFPPFLPIGATRLEAGFDAPRPRTELNRPRPPSAPVHGALRARRPSRKPFERGSSFSILAGAHPGGGRA